MKKLIIMFSLLMTSILQVAVNNNHDNNPTVEMNTYWPTGKWQAPTPEEQGMDCGQLTKGFDSIKKNGINIHSLTVIRNGHIILDSYFHLDNKVKKDFRHDKPFSNGQIIRRILPAPSLSKALLNPPKEQPVIIYLPPSYSESKKKYPVVYFLPGFTSPIDEYINGVYQGFDLKSSMDSLISQKKIKEMIVVLPNGGNFLGGSFYVNSPVTGNWEDFIVQDVVGYIDTHYRTIPEAASRGISGNSMGGFGALNIAMKHPDTFKIVYSLSPALFDEKGLSEHGMFSSSEKIDQFLAKQRKLASLSEDEAKSRFRSFIASLYSAHSISEYYRAFSYAYGAAFSPNKSKKPPYIDYPFRKSGNEVILDSDILKNYDDGFGGWQNKITQYRQNFLKLHLIIIDYGYHDKAKWIPRGCRYISKLFKKANIKHRLLTYEGGHTDHLRDRIEKHMLLGFSKHLHFESGTDK